VLIVADLLILFLADAGGGGGTSQKSVEAVKGGLFDKYAGITIGGSEE